MPHHADELDELQAHSHHHRVLEVVDGPDHLVVAREQVLEQFGFIAGGPAGACRTQQHGQERDTW